MTGLNESLGITRDKGRYWDPGLVLLLLIENPSLHYRWFQVEGENILKLPNLSYRKTIS
jgi:hypothetical protein